MAKDLFHEAVKKALVKDGWIITDDPLRLLSKEEGGIETDLGAEKIITATKDLERIAVEVKSFLNPSMIHDFLKAIGQYVGYETVIEKKMMHRQLYLAMPYYVYNKLEKFDFVLDIINRVHIKLILFNPITETIVEWKN
jgi:hypothetical protein